jgi:hypothetical protein
MTEDQLEKQHDWAASAERERIIALIERRICFDALADDDGRCSHHGGKCYDLRELITRLQKEALNGNV